ncbi:MAG TPA: hypothetical protein VFP23_05455 [Solirubrobacterales bacterium]|nr:hypothetical protein [Solirubrobacterales bacterium]
MRGLRLTLAAAALVASLALQEWRAGAAVAPADYHPSYLSVEGGQEAWHPSRDFDVEWMLPRDPSTWRDAPVAAVHYRVHNAAGAVVIGERRIPGPQQEINPLTVPDVPDVYTVEVWLEDPTGFEGPVVTARLRFDDARPAPVEPAQPAEWIAANAIPYPVRIGRPATQPLSGIAGYAVSVDSSPTGDPCKAADRCARSELDLDGGVEDDTLTLADLVEGTSYLHSVAVSGSGMKSSATGTAVLHVDKTLPVTRLAGLPSGWSDRPVTLTATATDALSGMRADGPSGPFTAIRVDEGAPAIASGGSVSATLIAEGAHEVVYYARDAAGNVDDGGTANGRPNVAPQTAVVRIDRSAPGIAFANRQDPGEPESIRARVADSLSGADLSRGWIGVRPAGAGGRFQPLPTEADEGGLRARWDSDAWPDGNYEFQVTGYDVAGNSATTTRRGDGAAMVLSNPLKTVTTLVGAGGWKRPLPYGRGASFGGRLTTGPGEPLAGMPVRVVERFGPGARERERVSTAWTDGEGRFAAPLAPGPSREVQAFFAGTPTLSRAATPPQPLLSHSGIRLRVSSKVATVGGRPIVFSGSVGAAGCAIPPAGKAVELQFRLPGLGWTEFRTVRTNAAGRFRYAYRFSDDDSRGVRFQFRAYAAAQGNWPYEPGGSRPVAVRGR